MGKHVVHNVADVVLEHFVGAFAPMYMGSLTHVCSKVYLQTAKGI